MGYQSGRRYGDDRYSTGWDRGDRYRGQRDYRGDDRGSRYGTRGQFGGDAFWEVKNGKKTRALTNVTYNAITTDFWGNLVAVAGPKYWRQFGVGDEAARIGADDDARDEIAHQGRQFQPMRQHAEHEGEDEAPDQGENQAVGMRHRGCCEGEGRAVRRRRSWWPQAAFSR